MDKIRITLTASAILLTFGSGGLTAQSVTEIAADAKLCKAISDDGRRLKCFDDLFAEKPNVPNTAEKSVLKAHWSIEAADCGFGSFATTIFLKRMLLRSPW